MDVSQFLKGAGDRQTKTVYLSPDPDALSAATVAAAAASGGSLADVPEDVAAARRAAVESSFRFVVGTVPASMWRRLQDAHRPTAEQLDEAKRLGIRLRFDADRFPPAATAVALRSATNPAGDTIEFGPPSWNPDGEVQPDRAAAEMVAQVWDTFPLGDAQQLWSAVVELNDTAGPSSQIASFVQGSTPTRSGGR